ncbi:hypothetical protein M408DRAFT_184965 [Serendipita vermifera MAFF 305830]|uniref:Uncharacterized protein n=1 Tax=Serendipita vermifera MAFF 305830 TaxID=933852 RepID=A0A0C3BKV8_SERVB|nr:hypothetical protein M408DRAFT_184965 [Serendipita vermifera MAFF 305830]
MPVGLSGGTIREKEGSHLRSASVDAFQQNQQALSTPGHQRNATTPVFGTSGSGTIGSAAGGTFGRSAGGPQTPRSQGSVLVKKHPSAKASPKPNNDGTVLPLVTAVTEAGSTPPGTGNKSTTPPKAPTPPGTAVKPVGMMSPGGPKPLGSKYPYQQGPGQGQGQAVLYSTPTSGNVLYSTPPSSPPAGSYNSFPGSPSAPPGVPPHHPNDGNWNPTPSITSGSTMRPSSPNKHLLPASGPEDDGPTPPLLSSAAFRDTISDQDTVRESSFSGGTGKPGGGGSSASMMSGRSAESYDVPVMWTGSGGLASVGMAAAGALGTTIEEDEREVSPTSPGVPGGWVNDPSPNAANAAAAAARRNSREARSSKEKERAFEAKVDGAQLVTVQPASFEAAYANAGILGADQTSLGRKSQEVVVQTVPGAETKESSKANGWVMVNVSGSGGESRPEHKKSSSTANVRPPPGPLRAVNASPQSSSSLDTPPPAVGRTSSANMAPPTSYNLGDLPPTSGGESSSSVDNSAPPSSTGHGNPTAPGTTNAAGGKRSGFRRLFSRDKGEKKSDERMRTGAIEISAGSSPKKGKKGSGEDAPQRASGKMSID